jgi:hypothetical protein
VVALISSALKASIDDFPGSQWQHLPGLVSLVSPVDVKFFPVARDAEFRAGSIETELELLSPLCVNGRLDNASFRCAGPMRKVCELGYCLVI